MGGRSRRVLILCTQNSCRSQMAEAFLRDFRPDWEVHSAGIAPAERVHPMAVEVMREVGFDLTTARPKDIAEFLDRPFDYVITVCDHARERCPSFPGERVRLLHMGFEDPAAVRGTEEEVRRTFRRVRDQIRRAIGEFVRRVDGGPARRDLVR